MSRLGGKVTAGGPRPYGFWLIGVYKLVKALVMFAAGSYLLRLDPTEAAVGLPRLAARVGLDPEARFLRRASDRLSALTPGRLELAGAGVVAYGVLYLAEGVGLLLQRRWGAYVVAVNAGLLIPFETYEIFHARHKWAAVAAFVINVLIFAYVMNRLRRDRVTGACPDRSAPTRAP